MLQIAAHTPTPYFQSLSGSSACNTVVSPGHVCSDTKVPKNFSYFVVPCCNLKIVQRTDSTPASIIQKENMCITICNDICCAHA